MNKTEDELMARHQNIGGIWSPSKQWQLKLLNPKEKSLSPTIPVTSIFRQLQKMEGDFFLGGRCLIKENMTLRLWQNKVLNSILHHFGLSYQNCETSVAVFVILINLAVILKRVSRTLGNIWDGALGKNSQWLQVVNYFRN